MSPWHLHCSEQCPIINKIISESDKWCIVNKKVLRLRVTREKLPKIWCLEDKKMERQVTDREKVFTKYISDKELAFKI